MKKILFVIDSLHAGGAARVTVLLANQLATNNYDVGIATNLSNRSCNYPVDPSVKIYNIYGVYNNLNNSLIKFCDHVFRLHKLINKISPDIIIGEQENGILYAKLASLFKGLPIVGHRHNTFKILGLSNLQVMLFNSVNKSVLLHKTDVEWVGNKIHDVVAIYNPCSFEIKHIPQTDKKNIITVVGSTKRYIDKGFDIMLDIWSHIANDYPEWVLHIIGGGSIENENILINKIQSYKLQNQVKLTGFVTDVERRLSEASIFLLPSRVEGFPMVINEAISQGCACASFSLAGVMTELYSESAVLKASDGDYIGFEQNLRKMLDSIKLRNDLSRNSQTELLKYLPSEIVKDWIRIIEELT